MQISEGVILGIMALVGTVAVALINARISKVQDEVKEAKADRDKAIAERDALREDVDTNRKDIISLGEHYAGMSKDVSILVVLVNKLYMDYNRDTGHKPDIDWAVLDRALTIQHKTSPLGVLEVK